MSRNFHESYAQANVKPPSERSTGLVFTVLALIVAAWSRTLPVMPWVTLGVAGALVSLSLLAPKALKPLSLIWFQIGLLLHRIVNPIVMFAMFVLVFVPAGLIMRIWHDPLKSRRAVPGATYWIDRAASVQDARSMTNQF